MLHLPHNLPLLTIPPPCSLHHIIIIIIHTSLFNLSSSRFERIRFHSRRFPCGDFGIEQQVNFLESLSRGFRVGEEDVKGHDEAENAEDDVCFPGDVFEGGREEVGEGEVEGPFHMVVSIIGIYIGI